MKMLNLESSGQSKSQLTIVSDMICPWCYIGKRNIGDALETLREEGLSVELLWRPFELNPDIPAIGLDRRAYRSVKFGSWEKSQARDAEVAAAGAAVGLEFRNDLITRTPNTRASHVLIALSRELGGPVIQNGMVEALFSGYFTRGLDVSDHAVLSDLGEAVGLDREVVRNALTDPVRFDAIERDEGLMRGLGLNSVPSVMLDGQFLFAGAQPASMIVRMLRDLVKASS